MLGLVEVVDFNFLRDPLFPAFGAAAVAGSLGPATSLRFALPRGFLEASSSGVRSAA